MKITYLALSEEYGSYHAGYTHTYNITKALGELGIKLDVFFKYNKIGIIKKEGNVTFHGVILPNINTIKNLEISNWINSYKYIKKICSESDVVYERFHINPIDLLFIGKKPYIIEINDPTFLLYFGLKKVIYKMFVWKKIKKCTKIITQTETLKSIIQKFSEKPIYLVPNGVDVKRFNIKTAFSLRNKYNISKDIPIVMFVGAFMQWHGVQDILEIAKQTPNAKFILIGNGPLFEEIKNKSIDFNNIILTGSIDNRHLPQYLANADITIAPFNTDRFTKLKYYGFWWCPVKLYEYMAAGKPIVSYDFNEISNIVKNSGILAEPGNLNDFIKKLKSLIHDKKKIKSLGAIARKISLNYSWKKRAKDLENILIS